MRTTLLSLTVLASACSTNTIPEPTGSTEQAVRRHTTVILVNGHSSTVLLVGSDGTNGFLTVTEDQINHTTGLDFSWATPDPADPDFADLYQGAGEIANTAYAHTGSTASLALTTPPPFVTHCRVDTINGTFVCEESAPLSFHLTWVTNGFGSVHEKTQRTETMGPVTTKLKAEFTTLTAAVSGTYGGHTATSLTGDLTDSESKTYTREITTAF